MGYLGSLLFEHGRLDEAAQVYAEAARRAAERGRPWTPYGFDARLMGAITAYVTGQWDEALLLCEVSGESPPALAEASLASVSLQVAAGRGEVAAL